MNVFIGCSGYSYKDWKGDFYPGDLPQDDWLSFYAEQFNTVEINNTFYKFPEREILEKWMDDTPDDFYFSIKAHRFFTHLKKFNVDKSFREKLDNFQSSLSPLTGRAGCVLWQVTGNLHKNLSKLESFCQELNRDFTHVLEFRHASWFDEEVYAFMKENNLAFCMLSAPGDLPEDLITTHRTAYVRFHGKSEWYDYFYQDKELEAWAGRLKGLKDIDRLFVYFNNDKHGHAVKNARTLNELFHL